MPYPDLNRVEIILFTICYIVKEEICKDGAILISSLCFNMVVKNKVGPLGEEDLIRWHFAVSGR